MLLYCAATDAQSASAEDRLHTDGEVLRLSVDLHQGRHAQLALRRPACPYASRDCCRRHQTHVVQGACESLPDPCGHSRVRVSHYQIHVVTPGCVRPTPSTLTDFTLPLKL